MLVRDPVVVTASLPHFLAPGDTSRLALDLASVARRARDCGALRPHRPAPPSRSSPTFGRTPVELAAGERKQVLVPISGERVGDDMVAVALTLPDGDALEKALNRSACGSNEPPVATTDFVALAPGAELSVSADALAGLVPGTASVQVSASGAGRLNVPAILRALDRYPYGCTEQITSRAMPLVYLNDVAIRAGLGGDPDIRDRVEKAIAGVLANQSASGSFGLWAPGGEDFWLDAYVTDFLTRARQKGFAVPAEALRPRARQPEEPPRLCRRLRVRRRGHRLRALRARLERPRRDRRSPLLRRDQARRLRHAARQGADRRGARALRRQAARRSGVPRRARRPRHAARRPTKGWRERLRLAAPRRRRHADARLRDAHRHRPRQPLEPRRAGARQPRATPARRRTPGR